MSSSAVPDFKQAGLGCEGAGLVLVVGSSSGQGAVVVVADAGQHRVVEGLGAAGAGLVGAVVGLEQGVGHRERPELPVGVGVGDRPQIPQQVSLIPMSG